MGDSEKRTFQFRKLVRDGVLDSMLGKGQRVNFEHVTGERHLEAVEDKFREEAAELSLTKGVKKALSELADLQQLIDDSLALLDQTPDALRQVQTEKHAKVGGFLGGAFIRTVEVDPETDSKWYNYFMDNPDRYPTQLD